MPNKIGFLAVYRIADSGDGRTVARLFGYNTTEQIQFIGAGDSNKKICVFNICLRLHCVAGTISHNAHHVIAVGDSMYQRIIGINNSDIMFFSAELLS